MKSPIVAAVLVFLNINTSFALSGLPAPAVAASEGKSMGAIEGLVIDKKTREPLAGVNITMSGTRKGTTTNERGEFRLSKIAAGEYTLVFDYIGYTQQISDKIAVVANQTTKLHMIEMEEQAILLNEIVVSPGSYSIMGGEPSVRQTLTSDDIKMMGWAEDITRAVQRIPGISGNDFTAKFNVRGGDVDEVLVLLDGMQVYRPFHQKDFGGGLFSTIDIETLEGVELLTGGFTAEYGDRMSGVLNMATKKPKENQHQTSVGLSLMNLRAFSMGTYAENRGSWLVSARRGYLDIINALTGDQFKLHPNYYDVLAKVTYQLHEKHTLSVHGFFANDSYRLNEDVIETGKTISNIDFLNTRFGNHYGWLTLESLFSPRLYARTISYGGLVTQKRFRHLFDDDPNAHFNSHVVNDDRKFRLLGLKQDWAYEASKNIFLKAGADFKKLNTRFTYSKDIRNEFITAAGGLITQTGADSTHTTVNGSQLGVYLSSRFQLANPLTLETGIRYDYASYTNDKLWSPRIGLVYSLNRATVLRAGWGYYYQTQNMDDLRIEFGEDTYNKAQLSKHYVLGLEHHLNNGLQLRAEGYWKRMSNVPDSYITFRNIDEFFPETRDDLIKLIISESTAKGVELSAKYDTGNKFSWWITYVLSQATDHVTDLVYSGPLLHNTGTLPRPWDQRHTFNLDANYRPSKNWHFNFTWQYRTGWPYTPFEVKRIPRGDGTFAYYYDYGLFDSLKYPAYHRLDVRINRLFDTSRGEITVFLHVINVYNHSNVNNYDFSILQQNADTFRYKIDTETWFPILPFIGVSWRGDF